MKNVFLLLVLIQFISFSQEKKAGMSPQNPSPMVEHVRSHERITQRKFNGMEYSLTGILPKPCGVFVPANSESSAHPDLLIHFHGAGYVVKYAAEKYKGKIVAVDINLGSGSGSYYNVFRDPKIFKTLIDSTRASASRRLGRNIRFNRIILSGFSAGYGAVKAVLMNPEDYKMVDAVLLLDGLHASYIPDGKVLYEGGKIDSTALEPFLKFASEAAEKHFHKRFLFTHSEIFPGTYVSTTESADYLISKLGLKNKAVLNRGPLGMQQLSDARLNGCRIMGFAGNTAPDHIDQLHSLFYFLNMLMEQ